MVISMSSPMKCVMLMCRCVLQVLIRWAIQNGTSVIPKATGVSHIQGNLEALNFELSKEEFEVLQPSVPLHSLASVMSALRNMCLCQALNILQGRNAALASAALMLGVIVQTCAHAAAELHL